MEVLFFAFWLGYILGNADTVSAVWKEPELIKKMDHPNIVKILNTIPLKDMQMVMVMEYLSGGELL